MSMIEVKGLKYKYPDTEKLVLDNVSFTIEKGEFIGLIGRNTAGKSTLCFALSGLVPHFFKGAYGGKVMLDGMEVKQHGMPDIVSKVGLVFENPFSQISGAKFNVFDEIAFGLENIGLERKEMIDRIEESLTLLNISDLREKNPFELSGGQMQRVAIASVIVMKPEVIILDEPTSQLDPQSSEEVFKVVENLTREGITIIMAEHKMEKVAQYADKVLLLDDGKRIAYDSPAAIFSLEDLFNYGVTPPVITRMAKKLGIKNPETGHYPVTIEEVQGELAKEMEKHAGQKAIIKENRSGSNVCQTQSRSGAEESRSIGVQNRSGTDEKRSKSELKVMDLHYSYIEDIEVLKGIDLTFKDLSTGIIGQNGAGKTTFVKLLKGLLNPTKGKILLDGKNITESTAAGIAKQIGMVFQNPNDQIFKNKVIEEVKFGALNVGQREGDAEANAINALQKVGLDEYKEKNPYDLNLSERKMISIASILSMNTDVLIFDEPTMGQDYAGKEKIKHIIEELRRAGKLVICILHDMDFAAEVFERIVVFNQGQVLLDGDPRNVFSNEPVLKHAGLEQPYVMRIAKRLGLDDSYFVEEKLMGRLG
ncbi:hypothetical protein GCM10011409_21380 [Lentibacillus populi]|uniref:ABC transporter domain-containing protein n=1 Tax=Lentibacillus populi TaxID=1827502 RepID=A0A9W5TXC4_9BACI|nr:MULTISPECIES: ABC transporter ATP-binding protein [Bacillaceae]GGB43519.1 hypothetical protein GCM10011409_21380 [Lentibacillus populi]